MKSGISRPCLPGTVLLLAGCVASLLLGAFAALPVAGAEGPQETPQPETPPAPQKWYEAISVNGFVSASYSYNLNRPASGTNRYRVFDFDDNTFKLDVAELVLQRAVSKAGDVGFRIDATAGGSVPRVAAASGLFRDPATGAAEDFDLQQAFVSWVAPVGRGLRLDIGKMVTTAGYEVVEGYDGFNDNATRSFLFAYAEPVTHTGIKAAYAFSDAVSANVMVVNGWDNVKDNNSSKTLGAGVTVSPSPRVSLTANYLYGRSGRTTTPTRAGSSTSSPS
ncbi:MAG: outer membrane beta-barrel protein [Holophagales bacterium]|nr:outer membrane beta-barrel protein [Holophagales bacterium]